MTKTEACQRVALAALLAGSMAAAQDARAGFNLNGSDLNGFADRGALPDGDGPDGAKIAIGTGNKPDTSGNPTRGSDPKRASNPDSIMVFFGGCPDRNNC